MRRPNGPLGLTLALVGAAVPIGAEPPQVTVPLAASGPGYGTTELRIDPAVTVDANGATFVVWQDFERGFGGDILASRRLGMGTFADPRRLNDDVRSESPDWGWSHSQASIASAPSGAVYVLWTDRRDVADEEVCPVGAGCFSDIYGTRSVDGGLTWAPNSRINDVAIDHQSQPAIAVDASGRLHAAWTDNRTAGARGADVYYARSLDNGMSWSASVRVNASVSLSVESDPRIAARGNTVYVVWTDGRDEPRRVYSAKSVDGGDSFEEDVAVDPGGPAEQRAPALSIAPDGGAVVVWEDLRAGEMDPDVYLAHNPGGGPQFSASVRVYATTGQFELAPSVAVDLVGRPLVSFTRYRDGASASEVWLTRAVSGTPPFAFDPPVLVDGADGHSLNENGELALSTVTGEVVLAWQHRAEDGSMEIRVARTVD